MAVSQNFLIGRTSGSAGGTRFATVQRKNIIASKQLKTNQKLTAKVLLNREKQKVVTQFLSKFLNFINLAYFPKQNAKLPFSEAIKFFRSVINDNIIIDNLLLNQRSWGTGNRYTTPLRIVSQNDSIVVIANDGGQEDDIFKSSDCKISVLVYSSDMEEAFEYINCANGSESQFTLNLPAAKKPGKVIKIAAKKIVKFRPGADLAGKVK